MYESIVDEGGFGIITDMRYNLGNELELPIISKIKKMTWNTIARWLKVASSGAQRFNDHKLKNFVIHELQTDEVKTFIQNKKHVIWLYTTMDV